jgi:hypothetical protein
MGYNDATDLNMDSIREILFAVLVLLFIQIIIGLVLIGVI